MILFLSIYLATVSIIAAVMTVADKIASKRGGGRVPERTLLLTGLIGGAGVMFVTMLLIRHKTRKPKFMLTLPLAAVVHLVIFLLVLWRFP